MALCREKPQNGPDHAVCFALQTSGVLKICDHETSGSTRILSQRVVNQRCWIAGAARRARGFVDVAVCTWT